MQFVYNYQGENIANVITRMVGMEIVWRLYGDCMETV